MSDSDSAFEIAISADTDGSNNSPRADVKIHFFGDEPLAIGSFKDAIPASNQLSTNFEENNDWAVERKEITKLKAGRNRSRKGDSSHGDNGKKGPQSRVGQQDDQNLSKTI